MHADAFVVPPQRHMRGYREARDILHGSTRIGMKSLKRASMLNVII